MRRYDGSSKFDSAQARLERRFSGGYNLQVSYTWSNFKESVTRLNESDTDYEERYQDTHLPHRLVMNGIWELPFGQGRRFAQRRQPGGQRDHRQLERLGDLELADRPSQPVNGQRVLRRRYHEAEDGLLG